MAAALLPDTGSLRWWQKPQRALSSKSSTWSLATGHLECYWESLAARWGTKPSQARGIESGRMTAAAQCSPQLCLVD
jgi:hypothetical protein